MASKAAMGSSHPLVTRPPDWIHHSQAPSQYSQQSSSYRQQSSFRQDHPSSMGVYGQESGGIFRTRERTAEHEWPDSGAGEEGGFDTMEA